MTAYLTARLNARLVLTPSRIRAATAKLAHVVQGRRKPGCPTLGHQPSERINGIVAALG
jgi:hypothetical protein